MEVITLQSLLCPHTHTDSIFKHVSHSVNLSVLLLLLMVILSISLTPSPSLAEVILSISLTPSLCLFSFPRLTVCFFTLPQHSTHYKHPMNRVNSQRLKGPGVTGAQMSQEPRGHRSPEFTGAQMSQEPRGHRGPEVTGAQRSQGP